jgi:hypothetical protein
MEDNPLHDFSPLRNFLIQRGYIVEQAHGYREIRPEEITIDSIKRGKLEVTEEGIYVIGPGDEKQQVFLYKRDYHLQRYGKPRFHICRCRIIDEFISSGGFHDHYVRANSDPVPVQNIDRGYEEVQVDGLPLCRYCMNVIDEYGGITSSEFVEILRQARGADEQPEVQEVDIFGYTRDWESISKSYREKHNYTCERCGLHIENAFYRQYMHCHHKDRNKLNNRESNLECLCMRCHSRVDDYHLQNLTTGANRIIMEAFNEKFPENSTKSKLQELFKDSLSKFFKNSKPIVIGE